MPDASAPGADFVPPPPLEFVRILESHLRGLYRRGRIPRVLRISDVEAGRCGIADGTAILGLPIRRDNTVPIGRARFELGIPSDLYEFALPIYFTEDYVRLSLGQHPDVGAHRNGHGVG